MHIVQATLYFIFLEFVTIFAWFAIVVNIKTVMNILVSEAADIAPQSVAVGQNVVTGLNVLFIILVLMWIGWYAYMAHSSVNETAYQNIPTSGYRRW
jgi:hypothetical protein